MSKNNPFLNKIRKAIKGKINDVFQPTRKMNLLDYDGTSDLVYVEDFLEHSEHQRRDLRNLLDFVKKGKYIGCKIPLCDNFPNRPFLREEMALMNVKDVHLELEDNIMIYVGKKI